MKLKNLLYMFALIVLPLTFTACSSDDDEENTHTDASALVSGTFTGSIYDSSDNEKASDVTVTINKFDAENVQASKIVITSTSLNMNLDANYNVAKAGTDRYVFMSGGGSLKNRYCGGELVGDDLTFYVTLNSKYQYNFNVAAKNKFTIKCKKVAAK